MVSRPPKNERLSSLPNSFYTVLFDLMLTFRFNANNTLELSFLNLERVPSFTPFNVINKHILNKKVY